MGSSCAKRFAAGAVVAAYSVAAGDAYLFSLRGGSYVADEKPKKSEGEKKKGGARDNKEAREAIDAARVKAMQKAEPGLNIEIIRDYVASTHQKKSDVAGKPKKK